MEILLCNEYIREFMLIEDYISFIVTKRWQKVGDFVLKMPVKAIEGITNYDDLIYDYLKYSTDTTEGLLIIESYEIEYNATDGETITLEGRDMLSILDNRIVWGQMICSGTIKSAIDYLVTYNVKYKNPAYTDQYNRGLGDMFEIYDYTASESINNVQFTGDNLLESIVSICGSDYSPFIYWDWHAGEEGAFVFTLEHASSNVKAYFSEELGNLTELQMYFGTQDYKNSALVMGEGEGMARYNEEYSLFLEWLPNKYRASKIYRKELFVDARNTSRNNGEISDSDYYVMLAGKGKEELDKNTIKRSITAKLDTTDLVYGVGYNVGDIIQISYKDNVWKARITEYIICQDDNGYQEYPNFEIII